MLQVTEETGRRFEAAMAAAAVVAVQERWPGSRTEVEPSVTPQELWRARPASGA